MVNRTVVIKQDGECHVLAYDILSNVKVLDDCIYEETHGISTLLAKYPSFDVANFVYEYFLGTLNYDYNECSGMFYDELGVEIFKMPQAKDAVKAFKIMNVATNIKKTDELFLKTEKAVGDYYK